jgi:hypothetical protein
METDSRPQRLQTSAGRIATLKKELETEMLRRNQLIVEMIDDGYSQDAVRGWAQFKSRATITHILAKPIHQPMLLELETI